MIISASRRTDIPALYSEWFMNRVRAGWCETPNPVNPRQVARVPLDPRQVDAIVFWSKNPAPMIERLEELDRMGFRYYFQFTLNDYPRLLEPKIPDIGDRIDTFLALSRRLGPLRVVWRYDPIVISNMTPPAFHKERFAQIARELEGATHRVMLSIVALYRKTERRLASLAKEGFCLDRCAVTSREMTDLLEGIARVARAHRMEPFTCAQDAGRSDAPIPPGRCIDESLVNRIWSLNLPYRKDPSQRRLCRCCVSKDIGLYDTCIHGCAYCYSTSNLACAQERYREHNPFSPAIWNNEQAGHPRNSG